MIGWFELELIANATISVAYFCIAAVILVPLIRLRQFVANRLATATMAIFFSCAVGHGLNALDQLLANGSQVGMGAVAGMADWWTSLWHALTACVAVYYLTLRQQDGRLLTTPKMFDDLAEHQGLVELDALRTESAARAEAEAARDYYAAMLKSINQSSKDLIYVKDLDNRYLMINGSFEKIFEVSEAELLGNTDKMLDPINSATWQAADFKARDGSYEVEEFIEVSDGRHYFASTKFPLFDQHGVLYAIAGVSKDITEQRRSTSIIAHARDEALAANEALAAARDAAVAAAAAKSTFLATMSHEIRTPMNAVIGMTDLLMDTALDANQHELLHTVRNSGDALLSVINGILDFSKIESGELYLASTPFNLGEEIENCLDLVSQAATAKDLDLVCYVDDSCPTFVTGDAERTRQIVVNLLSNAVKFTARGDVLITVHVTSTAAGRSLVRIEVTDTGIGISPDGVSRLFQSFSQVDDSTTRSYEGTGLGLVISQRLARAMGGDVTVTSTVGVGSCFTATIIVGPSSFEVVAQPSLTIDPGLANARVLIVDDNPTNLRILELQLSALRIICTTASTPVAALALADAGHRFDLAIVDMHMPDMNGVELAVALHATPAMATTPVILLTSLGFRPAQNDSEFSALLAKPVKSAALRAALSSALRRVAAPDRPPAALISPANQPLRILLAEDNRVNQRVAQLMLARLGHAVDIVETGRAAVDAAITIPYDVVLMDVQMPEMDGLEATRRIRSQLFAAAQPHIIAMTANAMVEDRDSCAAAGMDGFLTKPVRVHQLKSALGRVSAKMQLPAQLSD